MPEYVMVTIRSGTDEADFELPAKIPFKQWKESLLHALRQTVHGLRVEGRQVSLYWQDVAIPPEATLEQCGVYDGSILMLAMETM